MILGLILNARIQSGDIMVTLDRWSVYSLSRCVHTLDQVELDSQHAPSSSSRVGFGWYPRSASTHVPESTSTRVISYRDCGIRDSACVVCSCEVRASTCFSSRLYTVDRLFAASLRGAVADSTRYCVVSSVLPLKLGRSGIVNPRSLMNCHSLSAPKALVKM